MKPSSRVLVVGFLVALLPFHACDGNPVDVDPEPEPGPEPTLPDFSGSCDSEGGTVRTGTVSGAWTRNQSPHRVADTVYVSGELVIEAGALVCLGPVAAISWRPGEAGTLVASGTAEAPVVFTADRPGGTWGGFVLGSLYPTGTAAVDLTHVLIENATTGIDLGYGQRARVSDGVIRRITGRGVNAGGIHLQKVVVDSVCQGGRWCTAVSAWYADSKIVLEDVLIRGSGGGGVGLAHRSRMELARLRIEGSAGIGLSIGWHPGGADYVGRIDRVEHPIHITGGQGEPASIPVAAAVALLPSLEAQDRWTGNAQDVVSVFTAGTIPELVVGAGLAWRLSREDFGPSVDHLRMLPGARFGGGHVGRVTAEGTAEQPVDLRSTVIQGSVAGPSRVVHARLLNVIIASGESHPLEMRDVLAEDGYISLEAPASRLERVFVRGVVDPWPSHTHLSRFSSGVTPTEAVRIAAPDVMVEWCQVAHSPSDGIRVEVPTRVRIRDCNLEHNAGVGIRNVAADPVDARDNWWSDAGGPHGGEGDGVAGAVDFEPFRTAMVPLDAPVARTLVLTPSTRVVPVGDTVWFTARVLDGAGLPLWGESLEWRSSDTTVVLVDGAGLAGRVTGVTEATAQVTVMVRSDPALRETATVQVVAGAPPFRWIQLDLQAWSMWGSPEAGLYAGGHAGIHHYDGARWELRWSREEIGASQVRSIGGLAWDDLWAFGSAAAGGSALFRWDGATWRRIPAPFAHGERLWVAGPNQIYIVSTESEPNMGLWYYDGASFRQLLAEWVWGIWGRSPSDVFVGTSTGTLHFDGSVWRNTGEPRYAQAFWGTGDQIFSVSGWTLFRYDGAAWSPLDCSIPYATMLQAIWGSSPSSIYIAGNNGVVRHYDGSRCWTVWLGTESFASVWGLGSDIVFAGWSGAYHGTPRQ
jgi:hypothetical protein